MNEVKNAIESICNKVEQMEDRINEWEDRNFEIIQLEKNKEWKTDKKAYVTCRIPSKE